MVSLNQQDLSGVRIFKLFDLLVVYSTLNLKFGVQAFYLVFELLDASYLPLYLLAVINELIC